MKIDITKIFTIGVYAYGALRIIERVNAEQFNKAWANIGVLALFAVAQIIISKQREKGK